MLANYPWLMWALIVGWTGLSVWMGYNTKFGRKIGYINLCILGGFILVNVKVVPQFCDQYTAISNYFVPVGIVAMLFMADLRKLWKCGKKIIIMMAISIVVICATCLVAGIIFSHSSESWKLWSCITANFLGNFQSFSGVAASLGVDGAEILLFSATGMIAWMIYSLVAFTCGNWKVTKKFKSYKDEASDIQLTEEERQKTADNMASKKKTIAVDELAIVVGAAVVISGIGTVLGNLLGIYPILIYSTIAILIANFTPINKYKVSEDVGTIMFGMYIFSIGANATLAAIAQSSWKVTAGIFFVYIVSFVLIALITKLIKMPWEYSLLSHMSCIGGPVSVPALCQTYEWTDLLMPGIIIAVLGQVIASYLGIGIGALIHMVIG